jgi:hypothetical protein
MLKDLIEESKAQIARAEAVVSYSANALKGSASGNPIRIDDTSPLEHEIAVGLRSKNLLPYPYADTTKTVNGITFTDNGDGTITANGTASATVEFKLFSSFAFDKGITYTLSGCPNGGGMNSYLLHAQSGITFDMGNGVTFTFDEDKNLYGAICVYSGATLNNVVFKPQIELGTTASAYTPYVNANGAKVTSYGKNLLPYPYLNTTRTENGITFTDNGDGTVTANGIATGDVFYFCTNSFTSQVVGETYYLVGCPSDGGDKKYALDCYGGGVGYARDTGSGISVTPKDNSKMSFRIVIYSGASVNNLVFKPMLALGTTATDYEPYKEPTTYTADENGIVNGVTSVYPTTTLTADNGAIISAEYNRDINKAFAELMQAVAAAKEV